MQIDVQDSLPDLYFIKCLRDRAILNRISPDVWGKAKPWRSQQKREKRNLTNQLPPAPEFSLDKVRLFISH